MKKKGIITLIGLLLIQLMFGTMLFAQETEEVANPNEVVAQENVTQTETVKEETVQEFETVPDMGTMETLARKLVGSGLVELFIKGGFSMWPMLVLLIWAIATVIWKIVALFYAKINLNDFLDKIVPIIESGEYEKASEICAKTRGPVATIIRIGLQKANHSVEAVEKSIENAAVLEMAFLEKGFVALSTTISLAPMFGFFGTLVGMIEAFDAIAKAGEVDPTIVADGIKVALITSAAGLAIAIPVQFFNNIFMSMVDGMVIDMQRGSEKLIETLVYKK